MTSSTLRRTPTQERAKATFALILEHAASLLDEVGFDSFNTNLLAERAGIGVRAIYRYFPNKQVLVCELARQFVDRWRVDLATQPGLETAGADWRSYWCGYLDIFVTSVHNTVGGVAVLRAMRADPELRAIDDEANDLYIAEIARGLRRRNTAIGKADALAVAKVLMHTTIAVIDATLDERPRSAARLLDMLKVMQLALLERYLEP